MEAARARTRGRVSIENVNHPGLTSSVDAAMYEGMRDALLAALPQSAPGLTQAQIREAVLPFLPVDLYPGGDKAGWWSKAVQLDLEAKGVLVREHATPLRWHRAAESRRARTRDQTGMSRPPLATASTGGRGSITDKRPSAQDPGQEKGPPSDATTP